MSPKRSFWRIPSKPAYQEGSEGKRHKPGARRWAALHEDMQDSHKPIRGGVYKHRCAFRDNFFLLRAWYVLVNRENPADRTYGALRGQKKLISECLTQKELTSGGKKTWLAVVGSVSSSGGVPPETIAGSFYSFLSVFNSASKSLWR